MSRLKSWNASTLAGSYAAIISALAGCGSALIDPPVVPVAPVSGSIKFGAEVPVGASVSLAPVARSEAGIASAGRVKPDGTFRISTYGQEDGAPLGDYVILVQWFRPLKGEEGNAGGPNVIPKNYSDPAKSPLKVTVKEGSNEIPQIVIPRS
jgi:hypothetical protein